MRSEYKVDGLFSRRPRNFLLHQEQQCHVREAETGQRLDVCSGIFEFIGIIKVISIILVQGKMPASQQIRRQSLRNLNMLDGHSCRLEHSHQQS